MVDSTNAEIRLASHLFVERPRIVCLCGSTRFYTAFQRANYLETMAGRVVLSVGFYPHAQDEAHGEQCGVTPEQKVALDELHKRKIDLADEVLVLNVGGYVGESTRSEILYALDRGKPVRYLEADCDHPSLDGAEGPVALLGRMPNLWNCCVCGATVQL